VLRSVRWLAWTIVAYLFAAAVFELVFALRHTASPDAERFVVLVALVAMLVGAVVVFRRHGAAALIAPAAALFVTARLYTGDPYYQPYFQSYAENGIFSPTWVFLLLGVALVAAVTTLRWRSTAAIESVVVLALLMFTTLFMGSGH
jgi:hypothetical protein